jgi:hypothetical protein
MFRIDTATAASLKPAYPAEGTEKYFQDTDGAGGTIVPAWFLNQVQEEITNVIEDAGLTPDKSDDSQLSAAVTAIATTVVANGFTPSPYAGEESITFPNGLIIKTGRKAASGTETSVTFATPFPTALVTVTASGEATNNSQVGNETNLGSTKSVNGFNVRHGEQNTHINWTAIGY